MLGSPPLRALALALGFALAAPTAAAFPAFDEDEIYVGDFTIVSSTRTPESLELELTADLSNLAGGTFDFINVEVAGGLPRRVQAEGMLSYENIDPWETTGTVKDSGTITLTIPHYQVRAILSAMAHDGLEWELSGIETTIYQDGVFVMDDETRDVYFPGEEDWTAGFDAWTDLLLDIDVGDVIVFVDGCDDVGVEEEYLCAPMTPWEILDIYEDDVSIWVEYELRDDLEFDALIESGTLTGGVRATGSGMHNSVFEHGNKWESCELNPETEEVECSFAGMYLTENDMALGTTTELDGGVNMKGVSTSLSVRMREGAISEVGVDFEFDYDSSLASYTPSPDVVANQEFPLVSVHIPAFATQIGGFPIEIGIDVDFILGIEASFSSGAALGLAQRGTVGVSFSQDLSEGDAGFEATPFIEVDPFLSSPPTLAADASGSLRAWVAAEAQVVIDGGLIGGPSARLAGFTEFTVTPGASPWWEISAGGEVEGTLELSVLGLEIAAHTFGLTTETDQTASAADAAYSGVTGLASGEEVRWAENYHYGGTYGDYPVGVVPMDDGGLVFALWSPAVVARVDRAGQLLWDTNLSGASVTGLASFDGGILAFGERSQAVWIGELDDDGNEVQQHQYAMDSSFELQDVFVIDDGPTPSFVITGTIYNGGWFRAWMGHLTYDPSNTDDPVTWHWVRMYDSQTTYGPYPDTFHDIHWDDGDLYVAGVTTAGELEGHISYNALLMKLDSDGQQVWAKATRDGAGALYAVTMDDSGTLVAAGGYSQIVTQVAYFHSSWLGTFDADTGTLGTATGLSEDLWWEAYPDTSGYPSYTTPGASIYDAIYALEPLDDGGFAAIGVSGLGDKVGWVMSLDSGLNVRWLSTLEGQSGGEIVPTYIADTGHGLAVIANTTAPTLEGYGGGARDTLLVSLPYDGVMPFEPATAINSRYTKPDMVGAPDEGSQQDLTYLLTDLAVPHEAGSVTFSEAGISSWSLDPWGATHASMLPSTRQALGNQQKRSPTRTSPSKAIPSRSP